MKILMEDISLSYDSVPLFDQLTLEMVSGDLSCLLGRSGSGKTTILKLIAGIEQPESGRIYFDDQNVTSLKIQDRKVGWVPQQQLIFPGLNVFDNISYGLKARNYPRGDLERRVEEVSQLVGLDNLLERDPTGLSGGERQRVALARALAPEPNILLLDEPFSSLDAPERDRLSLAFRQVQLETGVTTIHVTHAPREAQLLSDVVYILSNGQILQKGNIRQIERQPGHPEVAKLLNLPNFIDKNKELSIDVPTLVPPDAIKIGHDDANFSAKILSVVSGKIFLQFYDIILEVNSDEKVEYQPGQIIKFSVVPSLFRVIDSTQNDPTK